MATPANPFDRPPHAITIRDGGNVITANLTHPHHLTPSRNSPAWPGRSRADRRAIQTVPQAGNTNHAQHTNDNSSCGNIGGSNTQQCHLFLHPSHSPVLGGVPWHRVKSHSQTSQHRWQSSPAPSRHSPRSTPAGSRCGRGDQRQGRLCRHRRKDQERSHLPGTQP